MKRITVWNNKINLDMLKIRGKTLEHSCICCDNLNMKSEFPFILECEKGLSIHFLEVVVDRYFETKIPLRGIECFKQGAKLNNPLNEIDLEEVLGGENV